MSFRAIDQTSREGAASAPALAEDPALAAAYLVAGGLMEICGPFFWAVLIVGFLIAEVPLD